MTTSTHTVSIDTALDIVADPCRRAVLSYLQSHGDEVVDVERLADVVASETDRSADDPREETAAIQLRHLHLPKLADAGLVEYDGRSETVRYHRDERVEDLLWFVSERLEQ